MHVRAYQRLKTTVGARDGLAGSFRQLLDRYPPLEQVVKKLVLEGEVFLVQVGDRRYLKNLKIAHRRFMGACRLVGLTANDYPLNQDEQGVRSLAGVLRDRLVGGFAEVRWAQRGARQKPAKALAFRPSPAVAEPFDTVEFDAHKLDVRLTILDQDPYGDEQTVEIERVWLLALIDVGTRVILGYSLCLRREYGRYDVIRTLEKALSPAQTPRVSIPDLEPIACGGFASSRFRRPHMRAAGRFDLITHGPTWPRIALMWLARSPGALSTLGLPTSLMIGRLLSASSGQWQRSSLIDCRAPPDPAQGMSFAS
jgi:putative transposase